MFILGVFLGGGLSHWIPVGNSAWVKDTLGLVSAVMGGYLGLAISERVFRSKD
jgi:uncharacterized protein YcfJ